MGTRKRSGIQIVGFAQNVVLTRRIYAPVRYTIGLQGPGESVLEGYPIRAVREFHFAQLCSSCDKIQGLLPGAVGLLIYVLGEGPLPVVK